MFGLFKRVNKIVAPVDGRVIDISEVPDQVFSERMAGDGVAILSTGDIVVSPVDGKLTIIFRTNHGFSVTTNAGIQVFVHIGVDTIALEGRGFERLVEEGTFVKAGEPIIKINRQEVLGQGYDLTTPVLIANPDRVKEIRGSIGCKVKAGENKILTYRVI